MGDEQGAGKGTGRPLANRAHSRRTLFTGAAMGLAGVAAGTVTASATPAAADGPEVLLGNGSDGIDNNAGSAVTSITSDHAGGAAFEVYNPSGSGSGIYGQATGKSGIGPLVGGVVGDSSYTFGIYGASSGESGVVGVTSANGASGIFGDDVSPSGGHGVVGVSGRAGGIGVLAVNPIAPGTALQVAGIAKFSRSGLASVAAGKASVRVTGVALTSASLVLANLQNSIPGVYVEAVVPNVSLESFEIVLSGAVPSGKTASVAWFIVN